MKRIAFTGGGTAGHVTPNIALIESLKHWDIEYFGSDNGIEHKMITMRRIPYHVIKCGKLRRYFSWQNFIDPWLVLFGIAQAYIAFGKKPVDVVFSKGGFVALPVVIAAWLRKIPVIAHESDISPGLANRLTFPFVKTICVTFAAAKKHFKDEKKVIVTGTPLRQELFQGSRQKGLQRCGFSADKPCLLIMGGGQGSRVINECIRSALLELTKDMQIIHLCGRGNIDNTLLSAPGYIQIEYADEDLPDLFAMSDIVVSRSGSNSLYEILALAKPHILIPLSSKVSRGDQIQNAEYFAQKGVSTVIQEESLTVDLLLQSLKILLQQKDATIKKIAELNIQSSVNMIIQIINDVATSKINHV